MSEETSKQAVKKWNERKKKEHLRYLQKKLNRPLTVKELKDVKAGRL